MPQNAASDQGLHCLLTGISIQNKMKTKSTQDTPKFGNGLVQLIRMEKSTGQIWVNKSCNRRAEEIPVHRGNPGPQRKSWSTEDPGPQRKSWSTEEILVNRGNPGLVHRGNPGPQRKSWSGPQRKSWSTEEILTGCCRYDGNISEVWLASHFFKPVFCSVYS